MVNAEIDLQWVCVLLPSAVTLTEHITHLTHGGWLCVMFLTHYLLLLYIHFCHVFWNFGVKILQSVNKHLHSKQCVRSTSCDLIQQFHQLLNHQLSYSVYKQQLKINTYINYIKLNLNLKEKQVWQEKYKNASSNKTQIFSSLKIKMRQDIY